MPASFELVLATRNRGKVPEVISGLGGLGGLAARVRTMDELMIPPVEETADSFEGNARIKAESASRYTEHLVLADDSGLEVRLLGGEPGVRSARFGGPGLDDAGRCALLLGKLEGAPWEDRAARFVCVIAVARGGATLATFEGSVDGVIALEPRGESGFGYDPVFYYPPAAMTFAELPPGEKDRVSHRGRALKECAAWLEGYAT